MSSEHITPLNFTESLIGQKVLVVLRTNTSFIGTLDGYDDFFNACLSNAVELTGNNIIRTSIDTMLLSNSLIVLLSKA